MRPWCQSDEQTLRALYGKQPIAHISLLLKRTEKAARSRAKLLGLKTGKVQPWSAKERKQLQRLYPDSSTTHLVEVFKRAKSKIYAQAQKLGLHKSAAFHEDVKLSGRFDKLSRAGAAFRYPKGHAPANKGLRRPGYAPGRMASTQFKKGRAAHESRNYVPIGTERINVDGYLERKVTDDPTIAPVRRWVGVHRLVWIAANGPVPQKHFVVFKDGDRKNIVLENLELISMAECGRRNNMWTKYPKELADVLRLKGIVNRMINKRLGKSERREKNRERREASRRVVRNAQRIARQGKPDGNRTREGGRAGR